MNGTPPEPLAPDTEQCGWVGLPPEGDTIQMSDYRWVTRVDLHAIYIEEQQLIEGSNQSEFASRLYVHKIPTWIDPKRPNVGLDEYSIPEDL